MSCARPEEASLPTFLSKYQINTSPHFYFHHIINEEEATLTVEVTGANLSHIFTHSRAKQLMSASVIKSSLDRKTVGFSTLAHGANRHIMAWAESGHGSGCIGDVLDADAPVLHNTLWTRRTIHMGTILGLAMARPFDKMGGIRGVNHDDLKGVFLGAHVEAKLAVHAVCLMLRHFKVVKDLNNITVDDLQALQEVKFKNGEKPAFEIYFSRKNCAPCGNLVLRLVEMTGIDIKLNWRHRLTRMVYNQPSRAVQKKARRHAILIEDDQAVDFEDFVIIEDDDVSDVETVEGSSPDKAVDLTRDATSRRSIDENAFFEEMQSYVMKVDGPSSAAVDAPLPRQRWLTQVQRDAEARDIPKPFPPTPVMKLPEELATNIATRLRMRLERQNAERKEAARLSGVRERPPAPYSSMTDTPSHPSLSFHGLRKPIDEVTECTPKPTRRQRQARFADMLPKIGVFDTPDQTHRGNKFKHSVFDEENNEEEDSVADDTPTRGVRKAVILTAGGGSEGDIPPF
ncbi:uncharacterized protein F5Z01DRAFT_237354 [Emericellopsis atlantica]|uniref:Uncharacterized protein n=1 Tax=Emericellopsis atlantica TaxID=2614577 RepID=A0A9P8CNY6_9HYPO|nr:uncharacterized protein F5Z01DRAFT_237354 [Emericellopsis atlantica]KAG9252226.1 hypothetical protein F5Z01DRAFT_237354 [Emericellopsis atlantica]